MMVFEVIIILFTVGIICYGVLPTIYYRYISLSAVNKLEGTSKKKEIALTFDDGPDSEYTLQLLDLLKENKVKATFFFVAKEADKHPDIIEKIIEDGHTLGLHSYEHKHAWLKGRKYTKQDFEKSVAIVKKHNWTVAFYRPPWGNCNIFTINEAEKYGLQTIFWNVMAQDWRKNITAEQIEQRLLQRVRNKAIICLHDGRGAKGAPGRTIEALKKVVPELIKNGYRFSSLYDKR